MSALREVNFTVGPRRLLFGGLWIPETSPLFEFAMMLSWISWVAKRCPYTECTDIHEEEGLITLRGGLGLGGAR